MFAAELSVVNWLLSDFVMRFFKPTSPSPVKVLIPEMAVFPSLPAGGPPNTGGMSVLKAPITMDCSSDHPTFAA